MFQSRNILVIQLLQDLKLSVFIAFVLENLLYCDYFSSLNYPRLRNALFSQNLRVSYLKYNAKRAVADDFLSGEGVGVILLWSERKKI